MVERYRRDDTDQNVFTLEHIGSIKCTAHSRFNDCEIDFFSGKVTQRTGRKDLKRRRINVVFVAERFDFALESQEFGFFDGTFVDGYTIPAIDEVGRGELADFFGCGHETRGEVGAG